ncbi:conjugal transfer nickase/helicase TraI [Klebsiella pneumoniae]|uniref:Conjugal transfer nickase/helicase TraI n=1 Tax=Klebsiella pneumoniae TaxID=573 RepID=A0A377VWG3_KLEPN|nr:conjugal transfer nickase/helicase TraI [Klebsiella pneumoniae]
MTGLITLEDAEGNTRLISPREAVAEGVTLYTPDKIRVGTGDRMRFTKSDRERGYVANSVWTVTAVSGDSVTLSDGQQTRVIRPGQERAVQHIDLAYAITAHGAQGASETFAIALEGTEGNRKQMAGFESAYVALSRMKQHVQVYTDNRQGWTDVINNAVQKELPTMCLSRNRTGGHECAAAVQYGTGTAGRGGRPCRSPSGGAGRGRQPCTVYCTGT